MVHTEATGGEPVFSVEEVSVVVSTFSTLDCRLEWLKIVFLLQVYNNTITGCGRDTALIPIHYACHNTLWIEVPEKANLGKEDWQRELKPVLMNHRCDAPSTSCKLLGVCK